MKTITLLIVLLFVCTACNSADSTKQTTPTTTKAAQPGATMTQKTTTPGADSLVAKRFPIRNKENKIVTLVTDFGTMTLELYHDIAPLHADSFVALTNKGFYNGTIFHRIIKEFMIQGGDPLGNGTGNAGYNLKAEFNALPHEFGTLSMARGPDPNSASSQFFICLARNRMTESLDKQYTVFGHLLKGFDVLSAIGNSPVVKAPHGEVSKPAKEVYLREAYLSDAEGNKLKK